MTIGRKEFAQTRVILDGDSAVGPHANWREYVKTWDESHLDLIPGEQPTRFLIRQLTPQHKRAMAPLEGYAKAMLAIRCFLLDWENYVIARPDGTRVAAPPPTFEDAGDLGRILTDASVRSLGLLEEQWKALFFVGAIAFSEAQLPLSRPSEPHAGPSDLSA